MTNPSWIAATAGQPPLAAHVDQLLVSHAATYLHTGVQQGGHTNLGSGSIASNGLYMAQSFTTGSNFSLGRIVLWLALTGAPVPTTVSIQTSSGGAPSGTVLASTTLPPAMVSGSASAVSIPLPYSLTSGTGYWIVVAAAGDASDYYAWSKSDQTSGASTSTNGSSWTAQSYGFYYAYYDQSAVLPLVHDYDDAGARWTTWTYSAGQPTALSEYTVGQTSATPSTSSVAVSYAGSSLASVAAAGTSPATPVYSAPHNGVIGDASATAGASQVNQCLGTHGITALYQGASILTPAGSGGTGWTYPLDSQDMSQPFTLSGTVVGRVEIPVLAVGAGADLLVSLCTDSAGSPGTAGNPASVIAQTRIPASWITQLSAVVGASAPSSAYPQYEATGSGLAIARFNPYRYEAAAATPYAYPAVSASGVAASPTGAYYDTGTGTAYLYLVGGVNNDTALSSCFSIAGNAAGIVAAAVPQPAFPQPMDGSGKGAVAVEPSGAVTLVVAGGATAYEATPTGNVYTAAIDTTTGNLGAWSGQTALPVNIQNQGMAASGPYVYVAGGTPTPSSPTLYNTVYVAQVQNSQITGWTATTPLPEAIALPFIAVVNGYLFVAGGSTTNTNTDTTATYYAPINADGTLGQWVPGPQLPVAMQNLNGYCLQNDPFGTYVPSFTTSYFIGFTAQGPGPVFYTDTFNFGQSSDFYVSTGPGTVNHLNVNYFSATTYLCAMSVVPTMSVPIPATGLTNGATYHIVMQQQGGGLTDYLMLWEDFNALPSFVVRTAPRGTYAWVHEPNGSQVPVQVFDQTVVPGQFPLHLWSDNGARVTTIVSASTPDQRILGFCEATRQSVALNANQGFETGIAPWTVTGGTGVQSSAHAFEGQYALQITPSGSAASVIAASEIMPCMPGQWCTADAHAWFTNSVTSNYSTSIAWYTAVSGGTQISTSPSLVSLPAATWSTASQALQAPAGAYGFQIQATLSGTPSSSQVWYVDAAHAHYTYTGPQNATATQITASGTWPAPTQGTGVVQLV